MILRRALVRPDRRRERRSLREHTGANRSEWRFAQWAELAGIAQADFFELLDGFGAEWLRRFRKQLEIGVATDRARQILRPRNRRHVQRPRWLRRRNRGLTVLVLG